MKPFLIILSLLFTLPAFSQSQDSVYYARLKTGQTLFSSTVRLRGTADADKYLALDNHRKIPIAQIDRFLSSNGLFVTVPGSDGTDIYRVDREGPKISLYSRLIYDPTESTYNSTTQNTEVTGGYTRIQYFRKPGEVQMHPLTYRSAMNALAENPESQQQIRIARTRVVTGVILMLASAVVEGIGIGQTAKMHAYHFVATTTTGNQYYSTPQVVSGTGTSPLVYIGAGGLAGGLVLAFGAHHNLNRAIDIYNTMP